MRMTREFSINLTGDVMLGRLIDQLFATHVDNAQDQAHAASFVSRFPHLQQPRYTAASPWGSTLPLFTESHLNLINLETAVTRHSEPWPGKAFNYRMHPANAPPILAAAHIDFASLANNHTLDFGPEGLIETAWTLKNGLFGKNHDRDVGAARVGIAGAGESIQEAISPAALELPRSQSQKGVKQGGRPTALSAEDQKERSKKHIVHVYAASDHPAEWGDVPMFHFIDYSDRSKAHLKRIVQKYSGVSSSSSLSSPSSSSSSSSPSTPASLKSEGSDGTSFDNSAIPPSLKIFSIHWGPNYSWHPSEEIRAMARFLISDCDIDIVHGHSSHHVQGVECPAPGKLIIYGCGDFVDDYAVHARFRNDLGAVYRVIVREENKTNDSNDNNNNNNNNSMNDNGSSKSPTGVDGLQRRVVPVRLEVFPTQIKLFQAQLLNPNDDGHAWVCERIRTLTEELARSRQPGWAGNRNLIRSQLGTRGQLIMDLV